MAPASGDLDEDESEEELLGRADGFVGEEALVLPAGQEADVRPLADAPNHADFVDEEGRGKLGSTSGVDHALDVHLDGHLLRGRGEHH